MMAKRPLDRYQTPAEVAAALTGAGLAQAVPRGAAANPPPDFVKCDVEGAEVAAFHGAATVLFTRRPVLLVEMHSPENHRTLLEKFAGFGYQCRGLDETHVLALPQ
ncbi:MAG: FkbM family methyltransferase [Dehalococcoidia bacterium]|nr:FkbM family methyltransferase [Dehalococcoidia bacterium]